MDYDTIYFTQYYFVGKRFFMKVQFMDFSLSIAKITMQHRIRRRKRYINTESNSEG